MVGFHPLSKISKMCSSVLTTNFCCCTGVLAVTRALGDSYMKELVTGHPYTTETVLQPEADEFIILACDGVCSIS